MYRDEVIEMPMKRSDSGCGGLIGWCIFFGILTFLVGFGYWGGMYSLLGYVFPGWWVIVPILVLGVAIVAWLAN